MSCGGQLCLKQRRDLVNFHICSGAVCWMSQVCHWKLQQNNDNWKTIHRISINQFLLCFVMSKKIFFKLTFVSAHKLYPEAIVSFVKDPLWFSTNLHRCLENQPSHLGHLICQDYLHIFAVFPFFIFDWNPLLWV